MSDADPTHPPYLRRITFLDQAPDDGIEPPVTVPSRLLLDGVDHSEVLARTGTVGGLDWMVTGIPEVLVSFVAYAEHVTLKKYPSRTEPGVELLSGTHIAGIPVLTPSDHEWELIPASDGEPELVQVWLFVRHLEVTAAASE